MAEDCRPLNSGGFTKFAWRTYRRKLVRPLAFASGNWTLREGLILRAVHADSQVSFAEVAPIPELGTESLDTTLTALEKGQRTPLLDTAISVLHQNIQGWPSPQHRQLTNTALLQLQNTAQAKALQAEGWRCFKFKIGLDSADREIPQFLGTAKALGSGIKLRLDANGSLDEPTTHRWAKACQSIESLEFLEQPMAPGKEAQMADIANNYGIRIALEESIKSLTDIEDCIVRGPQGPFIIKPLLINDLDRFLKLRQAHPDVSFIYSSSFESAVGLQTLLHLASSDPSAHAIGLGTLAYFENDGLSASYTASPIIDVRFLSDHQLEDIWNSL